MLSRFRTFFFALFVCVFFLTAASVIFYAFGYRFSFDRGIFIYTGSLSLKTNVETVDIKIDNQVIPKKRLGLLNNSINVAGITPGEHFIEVSAPEYKPWGKKIVVQSGMTTEFWNILLIPISQPLETLERTENVIKMFPAPNGLFATVKKQENIYSVETLDVRAEKSEQVFITNQAVFLPELHTNIEWSPESHKLMIPLTQNNFPLYAIVNIRTKETLYLNELTNILTPLSSPRWDATARDYMFFLSNGDLYRIDTESETPSPVRVQEDVAAYEISGNYIYYLSSENGMIYQIPGNGANFVPRQITQIPVLIDTQYQYSLIAYDEDRLAILEDPTGTLTIFNRAIEEVPLKRLGSSIKSLQYSDDGKKLLYYTDHEIFVYFNQDWQAQPMREKDSIIQVARFSTPIKNIQWAEDYEHVIFSLNNQIKIAEIDNRDKRDIADLTTLDALPLQILARFDEDSVYIVKHTGNEINQKSVVGINIPQIVSFFGF